MRNSICVANETPALFESQSKPNGALVDKFIIPPFSIFDSRQGYWQTRKKHWMRLGIESEVGRGKELTYKTLDPSRYKGVATLNAKATSIFDPVLCEVLIKWFTREGAQILDPFAGGSVRGIVATQLSRKYVGVELRREQVETNYVQRGRIGGDPDWICGDARTIVPSLDIESDFVFSCPPYADLEVYSDDPADLSTMRYEEFVAAYTEIIQTCCSKLKDNRFAAFVVSEVRNKKTGIYRGFVADTIRAFESAGLGLYNDVVLLNQVGTAAIRANLAMETRKLVRIHQNVLIFVKGDPKQAAAWVKSEEQIDRLSA